MSGRSIRSNPRKVNRVRDHRHDRRQRKSRQLRGGQLLAEILGDLNLVGAAQERRRNRRHGGRGS